MKKIILFSCCVLMLLPALFAEGTQEQSSGKEDIREVTWYFKEGSAQVTDDWYVIQKIQEDLGIHMTHVSPGGSDYLTRLQLMLAAREVPEVITSYSELTTNLIKWGVVAPVNKYVLDEPEKYIPDLARISNNWEIGIKLMTTPEGNIYGVPCTNNSSRTTIQWIRMDWLNTLGLEVPETQEEMQEVLYAFAHNDPDGNGKDDTFGTMFNEFWGARAYAVPFAASVGAYYPYNGGIILGEYHPRHKEYLRFLSELVADGSVDPEIPTLKHDVLQEKLKAGKFGYLWGWSSADAEADMKKSDPDAVWEPMAPWSGIGYDIGYNEAGSVIREQYLVSYQESEEDYAAIFSLFNWFGDDTTTDPANPTFEGNYWIAANGKRGEWWDVRADGKIDVGQWGTPESDKFKNAKEGIASWAMNRFRNKYDMAWLLAQPERKAKQFVLMNSYKTINDIPADDPNVRIRPDMVQAALSTEVAEQLAAFTSEQAIAWEKMFYEVVLNVVDIDEAWEAWLEQAERAGLEDLMKAIDAEAKAAGVY